MLLQSHTRDKGQFVMQILPALPDAWSEGEIKGLKARGGFAVDIRWKSGKLETCNITSLAGSELKVSWEGKMVSMATEAGKTYSFDASSFTGN